MAEATEAVASTITELEEEAVAGEEVPEQGENDIDEAIDEDDNVMSPDTQKKEENQ